VILDEAQNIKNPETKQARAARALKAGYRIALTGTPVENNIGDLWSIMEFLNPGFLGTQADFKRTFFVPIQANRNPEHLDESVPLKDTLGEPIYHPGHEPDHQLRQSLSKKYLQEFHQSISRDAGATR